MSKKKIALTDMEKENTAREVFGLEFQVEGLELNIDALQKQIDSQIALKKQRIELLSAKSQLEMSRKNLKIKKKQMRDGHFVDINSGDFMYREEPQPIQEREQ